MPRLPAASSDPACGNLLCNLVVLQCR